MVVYLLNFTSNMVLGLLLLNPKSKNFERRKKVYLVLTVLQFGLISGLRSWEVGWDTKNYHLIFTSSPRNLIGILHYSSWLEKGFLLFLLVLKNLGGSFQTMLIISSLFIMSTCCIFIYRHSINVLLSVFIIISFPFYYSSFDILRYFMGLGFLLLGYKYVIERKFFKFLVFILIGSLFHAGVLLFLSLYVIKNVRLSFLVGFIIILGTYVIYNYIVPIADWISLRIGKSSVLESQWFGSYGGGVKTAVMYGLITLLALIAYINLKRKTLDAMNSVIYVALLFSSSVIFLNARMATRLIMAFVPFMAISIPTLVADKANTDSNFAAQGVLVSFVLIGIVYHLFMLATNWQNVVPYKFFWV